MGGSTACDRAPWSIRHASLFAGSRDCSFREADLSPEGPAVRSANAAPALIGLERSRADVVRRRRRWKAWQGRLAPHRPVFIDGIKAAGARLWFLPKCSPDLKSPSNRHSPGSTTRWATPGNGASRTPGDMSATSSQPSNPTNAPTTSKMPDTLLPKTGTLSASTGYRPASSLLPAKKFHTREMYR